jgi:hypothetical protein
MFPSGQVYLAQCVAVSESPDGSLDTAALKLTAPVPLGNASNSDNNDMTPSLLSAATLATEPAPLHSDLLCIGNPSCIDLESLSPRGNSKTLDFTPPTWHTSVGQLQSAGRGLDQSPDLDELAGDGDDDDDDGDDGDDDDGGGSGGGGGGDGPRLLTHTCWTYWGHSGAPLFSAGGAVVGLHCAWDEESGIRQGQPLHTLIATVNKAQQLAGRRCARTSSKNVIGKGKKRKAEAVTITDLT